MKVTSCKISKELKEIGFEANKRIGGDNDMIWVGGRLQNLNSFMNRPNYNDMEKIPTNCYHAFDLETILGSLPKVIGEFKYWSTWSSSSDCYIFGYVDGINRHVDLETHTETGESLADTAARLLIKLIKDKVIKL